MIGITVVIVVIVLHVGVGPDGHIQDPPRVRAVSGGGVLLHSAVERIKRERLSKLEIEV